MRSMFSDEDAYDPSTSNHLNSKRRGSNVCQLLGRREICPRTKRSSKKFWGDTAKHHTDSCGLKCEAARDARNGLNSWVEAESLRNLSAKYCPLLPPPRSTIAAAFSPDGKSLASTHGDHTVKITDSQTGRCLKVFSGHRRTPWVVRFHPLHCDIIASGSLDHEVRLWDANTGECIHSRDFYRPIASLAFHAQGDIIAVASGHKLHVWHYNRRGDMSSPAVVLRTRRSLRAVHFHPHGAPLLLTAEVNDLQTSDCCMTLATSPGYRQYPPPTVYVADVHSGLLSNISNQLSPLSLPFLAPSIGRDDERLSLLHTSRDVGSTSAANRVDPSASIRLLTYSTPTGQYELLLSHVDLEEPQSNPSLGEMETDDSEPAMETTEHRSEERSNQIFPFRDSRYWDLPFLQGWLMGQSQSGQHTLQATDGSARENSSTNRETENPTHIRGRSGPSHLSAHSHVPITRTGEGAVSSNTLRDDNDLPYSLSHIHSELATTLAATATAELPCTVKLRIWKYDVKEPCLPLEGDRCLLTIPHAVLCSEMGAHFSPCGRFLAACVACVHPHLEADACVHNQAQHDLAGLSTSPTRHPTSAHKIVYELRIYSLEESTFGKVLASRAIRAAHCLTSIQFSPTSEHLLLAYGRRHGSLLKSVVIDGETTIPIYTVLEVYRVFDMELVRVLPSADDEVNVACFHPSVGCGFVYGTKEGKLRILQSGSSHSRNIPSSTILDEHMLE